LRKYRVVAFRAGLDLDKASKCHAGRLRPVYGGQSRERDLAAIVNRNTLLRHEIPKLTSQWIDMTMVKTIRLSASLACPWGGLSLCPSVVMRGD